MTTTNNTITPAFLTSTVKEPMNTRRSPAVYKGILFGVDTLPDPVPWAYEVTTDMELGGGWWSYSNAIWGYIRRTLQDGWTRLRKLDNNINTPTLILSETAAGILVTSDEIRDFRYQTPTEFWTNSNPALNPIPVTLYGFRIQLDHTNPESEALLTTADRRMGIVIKVS